MALMIAGLVLFLGIHLVPALPPLRQALAGSLGEARYKSAFSLVSALGLVAIVVGYAYSGEKVRLFAPYPAAIRIAPEAMTLAFILLAAANMRGYLRHWLKHPMLLGILLWSGVHLLANGDRAGTILFGAFFAYAIVDLISALARGAVKSFVPAVKYDAMAVVGGIALAVLIMTFHRWLFGVRAVTFGV